MSSSWLRIVTYTRVDCGTRPAGGVEDRVRDGARLLAGRPGYRGGHWGHDPDTGAFAAVTNWASREAIDAVADGFAELRGTRAAQGLMVVATAHLRLVSSPRGWSERDWAAMAERRSPTFMRVALYTPVGPGDGQAAYLEDSAGETAFLLTGVRGFLAGYWGLDPETGAMAAVTYWTGRDAIDAAASHLDHVHAGRARHGAMTADVLNLRLLPVRTQAASEV